jgi:hypothetical protein
LIQLSDYFCGGYFVTRPAKRTDWQSTTLPETLLSVSRHICTFVPDAWSIEWAEDDTNSRLKSAAEFNLEPKAIEELTRWATDNFDKEFGAWYVIFKLETAQQLRKRFLGQLKDVAILGVGLHKNLCNDFLLKAKAPASQPGFAPNGEGGDYLAMIKRLQLASDGIPLGFEPVNRDGVPFSCSWLCNGLEKDAEEMKIPINSMGLIDDYSHALKFTDMLNEGKIGAEPGPWWPWLLVDYSNV